jgi:outer membrane biogenesis lipoprotein LolB
MRFSLVMGASQKAVVAFIVAAFLAGCTTAAQRQYQASP